MKKCERAIMVVFMVVLATLVFGMVTPTSLCQGGCFVIGGGHLETDVYVDEYGNTYGGGDLFGGNVMGMKDGSVRGEWQNIDVEAGVTFHGYANVLICWHDGGPGPDVPRANPNRAVFGGEGTYNGEPGYLWIVAVADYKEGADADDATRRDAYAITIYEDLDGDGVATAGDYIVYEEKECIIRGDIQIFPTNGGHPYIPGLMTAEMNRISSTMDLCPGI